MPDLSPLQRQRRFLILMSLGVIAFYFLRAEVSTATFSGVAVTLGRPMGVIDGMWIIWGWALLRYGQRVYELLSKIWDELFEDVCAEDLRIALRRARRYAKHLAKIGELTDSSKKYVLIDGPVRVADASESHQDTGQQTPIIQPFVPTESGGRKYQRLKVSIRYGGKETPGFTQALFEMEMTPRQVLWLKGRAWIYAIIGLPAFTEHIVPIVLALLVPFAPLLSQ
jgi:hypothetical protein